MTQLFSPFRLRAVEIPNRIVLPPMCQFAAVEGVANEKHFAHYARFALGGMGLIIVESTAVDRSGRISYGELGLWNDAQISPLRRITSFIADQGAIAAIQLGHGGRKAAQRRPWHGGALNETDTARGEPPWPVVGPSALPVDNGWPCPTALDHGAIRRLVNAWREAACRAGEAGFDAVEIHAAHGYLPHQFLSPLSNVRADAYGGDRSGRMRFLLEIAEAVRDVWPNDKPLLVRVSAVDGLDGGWNLDDTVALAQELKLRGVDAIDCSSGGLVGSSLNSRIPRGPGFQVPFAERVRREAGIPTIAVGLIQTAQLAAQIVDTGQADLVAVGREALIDPNWALRARTELMPERGYADWPVETGWWLERRKASVTASSRSAT